MSSVDSRIVTMKMDNQSLLTGVSATINALANLKNAMNFKGANKGLTDLQNTGSKFNLGGMGGAVEGVSAKFLAMSTIAITALANITNRAINAGAAFVKSFTIGPLQDGLAEYETNLKSIQTIEANTGASLKNVNATLDEMNEFSDKTIYNFSEMARNMGTFTAAGVDLKTSASAIKGIANLAALSGSNSQQASTAMYQLSQAIASGKVGLQDWNSVVNAGMGGKKFQTALASTAVAMGKLKSEQVQLVGPMKQLKIAGDSFRNSISAKPGSESWLSSEILVNTLSALDGRFSKTALAANGLTDAEIKQTIAENKLNFEKKTGVKYTDEQFASLTKMADAAFKAATESKTFSDVMQVAKESVGSGWAASFRTIFGDLKEAKTLWTGVAQTITAFTGAQASARNEMLASWKSMGGRALLIDALKQGFQGLMSIIKPIKDAFRDIFPAMTAERLISLTKAFQRFMISIKIGSATAGNLRRTFQGVFALLSIGWSIIKGLAGVIGDLFGALGGDGDLLRFTGSIGQWVVQLDLAIKKGGLLVGFFETLSKILTVSVRLISSFAGALSNMFANFDLSFLKGIGDAFRAIGDAIADAINPNSIDAAGSVLTAGLMGGVFLVVKRFVGSLKDLISGDGGPFAGIKDTFDTLTGSLKSLQTQVQAKTLMLIAGAVGILAVSLVALSMIDSKKLAKALGAMAVAFGQLLVAMAILSKIAGNAGFIKVPLIAASMVMLASAVLILTGAIALMGQLEWSVILKGMVGVAGSIVILGAAIQALPEKRMALTAAGLALMGAALAGIAGAMVLMATLSWEEIARGFAGLSGAIVAIAGALKLMGPSLILTGPGLVAVGFALGIIAGVMQIFASMNWDEMSKGMAGLAGSLAILAVALKFIGVGALPGAAALLIVAPALLALAGTLKILSGLSWEEIAQGLVALGGALLLLTVGLRAIGISGIIGATALLVVAPALLAISAVLKTLGGMSWSTIATGLVALAGALAVIGIAGYLLAPVVLPLIGLGVAMVGIGAGFALAGVGVLAFSTAFAIFIAAGAAGIATVGSLIALIPAFAASVANGVIAFAGNIAKGAPAFLGAFRALLTSLLTAVIQTTPKIISAFMRLLSMALVAIVAAVPRLVNAGFRILMGFLSGIRNNIGKVVDTVADIIVRFLNALGRNLPRIIQAGVDLILSFIRGITRAVNNSADDLGRAGLDLAMALINGMTGGLLSRGIQMVKDAATKIANSLPGWMKKVLGIKSPSRVTRELGQYVSEGLALGVTDGTQKVERAAEDLGSASVDAMKSTIQRISTALSTDMDTTPVIAPVLDLSNIHRAAGSIGGLLGQQHLSADVSYARASSISASQRGPEPAVSDKVAAAEPTLQFVQNNHSPKALSAIEIYRQTRNQLSLAKEALSK